MIKKGREVKPFKLESAILRTSHYQDGSVTAAKLAAGAAATLTVAETEVFNGTVTTSGAWQDLDLSGTIGANAALVLLKAIQDTAVKTLAVRKNGDTDEFYRVNITGGCALVDMDTAPHHVFLVATDASGVIEICFESNAVTLVIDVITYIK